MEKKKRRNKSNLGDDFIAPDGGWGWLICVAGGLSNLSILPVWGSFGLIFRNRLMDIGLSTSQITTIVNTQPAILSCTGLFNGPIYRRFSYRQVALTGSIFIATGLYLCSLADSFLGYLFAYSIMFGIGMGLSLSSTFLTLNTYFKEKRRRANSFLLTISGCGPIFWPYVANALLLNYGVNGAAKIFSAISLNAFACGLMYQPVKWHTKKKLQIEEINCYDDNICVHCKLKKFNENQNESFEISLVSKNIKQETENSNNPQSFLVISYCKCDGNFKKKNNESGIKLKWYQEIIEFFDLDLLKDCKYLNLMIGLTFSTFSEQNFTILVPFFLGDFNFNANQTAIAMSLMGFGELLMRFLIPFVTAKIYWDNRVFFMIGITGMTIGRILIAQIPKIEILFVIFGLMGICRALRTVFMGLVIPDYVPLNRLPAATGLQLLSAGLFTFSCGPFLGLLQDLTNSKFILYFLSLISGINVVMWTIEMFYQFFKKKLSKNVDKNNC